MLRKGLPSAVTLLVLLASGCAASSTVGFKPPQNYRVGTHPTAVVKADFNADGDMDLAVANYGDPAVGDDGSISILLGNGDGTFRSAANFVGVKNCTGLLEADFDTDGKTDLALIRRGDPAVNDSGDVTIFFGNGDGTFHKGQSVTTGRSLILSVVAADFNLDQRPDLAISQTDNSVSILMGKGDGTFQSPVVYATPTGNLGGKPLTVLDFNQDGIKDLAALDRGGDILLGNGDGSFHPGPSIPLELFTSFKLTGDFNGDGKVDLLATHCNPFSHGCSEQLLLGNGDGTFTGLTGLSLLVYGAYTPGDFNGDGKLDLAGTAQVNGNPAVVVCLGNGDGTFQAAATFPDPYVFVALADDLNGDKASDLVMINSSSSIGVLLNTGTDFSISASAPTPSILSGGQNASSTLSLSLLNGFDNPVSLSCSVAPAQMGSPTCALSSSSITFDSEGKASATVTVTAGAVAAAVRVPAATHGAPNLFALGWLPVAGVAFMGISLSCTRTRKGKGNFLAVVLVVAGLILLVGCGGGSRRSPPVNYAITITALSGSTQHSTAVTLTVQ